MQINKKVKSKTLTLILFLILSASMLYSSTSNTSLCYGKSTIKGRNIMGVGMFYGVTTPIKNVSDTNLTDVTIIKTFDRITMSMMNKIAIDGVSKTIAKDSDQAEINSDISGSFGKFNGSLFNKGIVYRINNFGQNKTHTIYDYSMFSFDLSKIKIGAKYTKNGQRYYDILHPCDDGGGSSNGSSPIGIFNVVHDSFSGKIDPTTNSDPSNALYTQVVSQPFHVKVLALASNKRTLKNYDGDVNVSIISTPNYTGKTTYDQTLCNAAGVGVSKWELVSFGGKSSERLNITPPDTAISNASFIVQYYDTNTKTKKYVCSRDVFAIRPYAFKVFGLNQYQRAGEDFNVTIMAVDKNNFDLNSGKVNSVQGVAGYNAPISDLNLTSIFYTPTSAQLSKMRADTGLTNVASCPDAGVFNVINSSVHFINGEANVTLNFSETGILALNVAERSGSEFAYVDRNDTNDSQLYIAPANKIYDNSNIANQAMLEFVPYQFTTSAIYTTTNGKNWLYMNDINQSTKPDMAALVKYTITAQNEQNATTKNYTSSCFPDTSTSAPTIHGLKLNTTFDLFLDSNITSSASHVQLLFYTQDPENNKSIWALTPSAIIAAGNNSFREWIGPKNFKDGIGKADVYFDINRSVIQPRNPISIKLQDANTSTSWMTNLGSPKYFIGADINTSKSFIYGRTDTLPHTYSKPLGTANTYFEAYCNKDGNKTLLPHSQLGIASINWYQNLDHNSTVDGTVGLISEARHKSDVTGKIRRSGPPAKITLTYVGKTYPYATTMQNKPSAWLIYNLYNAKATTNTFRVEFDKPKKGNWIGVSDTNTSTDSNASAVTIQRVLW